MDFSLTDDQELLQETAAKLLERECSTTLLRSHIDDRGAADALWGHLSGFVDLAVGPCADACLFLEQTGYVAAPGPFLATLLYGALTGDTERVGTVALVGDEAHPLVLEADRVETVAFVDGAAVSVVRADELERRPVPTVDFSRRLFEVDPPSGRGEAVEADRTAWRDRAHACLAAEIVGVTRRIFDMALAHAKDRRQFGAPIGSFQAIQHKLAEMSLALERATASVHYAAMTVDAADADRTRACHVAKAAAGEAARRMVKDGIQIHGGIGYTWDHDLHLFLRRATGDEYLLGTSGWHLDRLADAIF